MKSGDGKFGRLCTVRHKSRCGPYGAYIGLGPWWSSVSLWPNVGTLLANLKTPRALPGNTTHPKITYEWERTFLVDPRLVLTLSRSQKDFKLKMTFMHQIIQTAQVTLIYSNPLLIYASPLGVGRWSITSITRRVTSLIFAIPLIWFSLF